MPRKPREDVPGAVHHVTARGNRKQEIFLGAEDRETYLDLLGEVVALQRWLCLAYCLMANHVHLLIETPEGGLGRGMQLLHGLYADTFNKRHGKSGHLFQGRYGAVRVETDEQLWVTARYIAMNPVEAGLCETPGAWRWSSHAATVGARAAPPWLDVERLRGYFGTWGAAYEAVVR
ncbi:MAG TPA: transposase [Solirubrobacteraceae bacterium]|nr:transposase [Solirubrobacteraceae bacterium]